jgi:hypothetical protein
MNMISLAPSNDEFEEEELAGHGFYVQSADTDEEKEEDEEDEEKEKVEGEEEAEGEEKEEDAEAALIEEEAVDDLVELDRLAKERKDDPIEMEIEIEDNI